MTLQRPLEMQAAGGDTPFSYAAIATRQRADNLWASEGVVRLGLQVTQRGAGANMSVDVAAGSCVITGDDVTGQGKYLCVNDAGAYNVTVPAAPASGTRIHRVVARIKDKLHNGAWTTYEWTIELLADTGSGTPALPASAISLARVTVAAGQVSVLNANITDDRINAALGAPQFLQVSSDAGRPPNPFASEIARRTDKGYFEAWTGSAWVPITVAESWTALTLNSGFVNHSFGYAASYRFVGPNTIRLSGTIAKTASAAFASNDVPITLAAGLRPASQQEFVAAAESTSSGNGVRIDVLTTGNVTVVFNLAGYTPHWVSLDGIQVRLA
jgi:hypothetical protein